MVAVTKRLIDQTTDASHRGSRVKGKCRAERFQFHAESKFSMARSSQLYGVLCLIKLFYLQPSRQLRRCVRALVATSTPPLCDLYGPKQRTREAAAEEKEEEAGL